MKAKEMHGGTHQPEYVNWKSIRARCLNPNCAAFHHYGGRGIAICAGWESFAAFRADMGPRPSPKHEVDRIDNEGGYWCGRCEECIAAGRPANCRWATRSQQTNNTRVNARLEYAGRTLTVAEWAREVGITVTTIRDRLKHGWSVQDTLTRRPGTVSKGRPLSVCRRGHVRTPENTYVWKNGWQYCKECERIRKRRDGSPKVLRQEEGR